MNLVLLIVLAVTGVAHLVLSVASGILAQRHTQEIQQLVAEESAITAVAQAAHDALRSGSRPRAEDVARAAHTMMSSAAWGCLDRNGNGLELLTARAANMLDQAKAQSTP